MKTLLRFVLQVLIQVPILTLLIIEDVDWFIWVPSYILLVTGTEVLARDRLRTEIFAKIEKGYDSDRH